MLFGGFLILGLNSLTANDSNQNATPPPHNATWHAQASIIQHHSYELAILTKASSLPYKGRFSISTQRKVCVNALSEQTLRAYGVAASVAHDD